MNILTVYAKDASKLLSVLDDIVLKIDVKVLASDPARLYNDANHEDVNMASITFRTLASHSMVRVVVNSTEIFVCEENLTDWE